jgi:hypothetical protein
VWEYQERTARPAVAPPSPEAARLLQDTASVSWPHLPAAYDHAVRLAGLGLDDLLGVLVHPPMPADDEQGHFLRDHRPELWIRAVQTFACLGIAHHRADQPWPGSERRRVLLDLLHGPEDWVNEAAAFAMVASAWVDPSIRADVGERIAERMVSAGDAWRSREVTILASLCRLVLLCPWLDADRIHLARELREAIGRAEAVGAAETGPGGAPKETGPGEAARAAKESGRSVARAAKDSPGAPRRGFFRRRRQE